MDEAERRIVENGGKFPVCPRCDGRMYPVSQGHLGCRCNPLGTSLTENNKPSADTASGER